MDDNTNNTNNSNKTRRRIIEIIIIIIILLLLLWSCKSGLLGGNGKGDNGDKGKTKTSTKVQEEVQKASVYPSAIDGLVYTGKAQALISKGAAAKGYKFVYSLSEDGTFTKSIPTMTDAGSYVVYWRYVKKGKVVEKGSIPVSIAKAQDKATVVGAGFAEDGSPHNLIASASTRFGATIMFSLDGENYSTSIPQATKAGTYKVYWKSTGGNNYKGDSGSLDVTVSAKAKPEINIEFNEGLVYNGKDQRLIKTASGPSVTIKYSLDGENWSEDYNAIIGKDPGEYTVYYKTVETAKYASVEGSKTLAIAKAELNSIVFKKNANNEPPFIYDGTEKTVTIDKVLAGVEGGLVELDSNDYDIAQSSVFSATAVNEYKVTLTAKSDSAYFTGSVDGTWEIEKTGKFGNGSLTIKGSDDQYSVSGAAFTFNGSTFTPEFKVEADGVILELGKDYEVDTTKSTTSEANAGTYTIQVKGLEEYADSKATATWTINPIPIGAVTFTPTELEYSGEEQVPTITVKNVAGVELVKDTDYTVTYYNASGTAVGSPIEMGNYTAKVTGINNYTGEDTSVAWTITADYVARIGDTRYTSLESALEAVPTGKATTIVMLDPVTNTKSIDVPENTIVVIDFATYGYSFSSDSCSFNIPANSTVTMNNGALAYTEGTGTIINNSGSVYMNGTTVNGNVKSTGTNISLKSGTVINGKLIVGDSSKSDVNATVESGATVNNFGACAIDVHGDSVLSIYGTINGRVQTNAGETGSIINVRSGAAITAAKYTEGETQELAEGSDVGVYIPNGTLNIYGGTIQGTTAVYFKSGTLEMTGGSLDGIGPATEYSYQTGYTATGDALVVDKCSSVENNIRVSGGYFYSENADPIGSYKGNGQATAESMFVSGGYFSKESNELSSSGLIASGFVAKEKTDAKYISEVVEKEIIEYTVSTGCYGYDENGTIHTDIDGGRTSVTPIGGKVDAGNSVTLTADTSRKYGEDVYRLSGWSSRTGAGTENDPYVYTPINDDTSGTLIYTPSSDVAIVARYVLSEKPLYHLTINADNFSIDYTDREGEKHADGTTIGEYDALSGTDVTVTYTGTKVFESWNNSANKIVSNNKTYTFKVGSMTSLYAITRTLEEKIVYYISADGQSLGSATITENTVSTLTLPNIPSKSGYVFDHWILNVKYKTGTADEFEITSNDGLRQKVSQCFDSAESFTVVPSYTKNTEVYVLTVVYNEDGSTEEIEVTKDLSVKVKASKEFTDKVFSTWSSDAAGNNIISYCNPCTVYMNKDKTIYANYAITAATKKPTVTLDADAITDNDDSKIRLTLTWDVPDDYTMIEYGFLYSTDSTIVESDLTTAVYATKTKAVTKKYVQKEASSGSFCFNGKVTGNEATKLLKAKGYIIYRKNGVVDTEELYTTYFENTWNGLKG